MYPVTSQSPASCVVSEGGRRGFGPMGGLVTQGIRFASHREENQPGWGCTYVSFCVCEISSDPEDPGGVGSAEGRGAGHTAREQG